MMVAHTLLQERPALLNNQPFVHVEDGRALAQAIVDTIREPLLVFDQDLRVVEASRSFYLTFKIVPRDVQRRPVCALGDGQWNIQELKVLLEKILPQCSFDLTTEALAILRARASLMPTRVGGRARGIDCELDMKLRETRQRQ
jgi:hypothetical protein